MRAFSGSTIPEQPTRTNRRQPVRQTRTNPARTASGTGQAPGAASAPMPDDEGNATPGFFPALTHYTDAITALPKEMIRHNTMLKEVDAKIYGPEKQLGEFIDTVLKASVPPQATRSTSEVINQTISSSDASSSNLPLQIDPSSHPETSHPATGDPSDPSYPRGLQFDSMRSVLHSLLTTLDEKNHVINTANDCLDKQIKRCNSSLPHIDDEISEEARLGSMTHWAYTDKAAEKKGIIAGERTRRAANDAAARREAQEAAMRSESRRDALASKKPRNQHLDSDFDDGRTVGRKPQAGGKGRKVADTGLGNGVGLGIVNGTVAPNKRRKIEKPTATNLGVEKAMASVYGPTSGNGRGVASSPRDLSVNETTGKKKGRGGATINGNGRRRAGTNASATNSPLLVSSPVIGTFNPGRDRQGRSPAPATMQRMPSSRARQNSTQSTIQTSRNRSSSINHKGTNGNNMYGTTADIDKVSGITGRTTGDVKKSMKETVNAKGEHLVEDIASNDGPGDLRGGLVVGSKNDRAFKKEESVNGNGKTRPPSISVSTRGGNSKQASKTATPINATFAEPQTQRTRGSRELPPKRSHKKGAGLAAQIAAAAATQGEDGDLGQGDDDNEEEEGNEPLYCYCNEVSYGQMVGCDMKGCPREWFHLACVGMVEPPSKKARWYCDECKDQLKDSKFNGVRAK